MNTRKNKSVLCVSLLLLLSLTSPVLALKPRWTPPKPQHTVLGEYNHKYVISVKFIEGIGIRLRDGNLVSLDSCDLKPVHDVIARYKIKSLKRLFTRPEEMLNQMRETGQRRSGKQLADLNNYYRVELDSSVNPEQFIDDLNSLDLVEIAYAQSHYALCDDIHPETPDFTGMQEYLDAAPEGIGARQVWDLPGGKGKNVKVIDIDIGYNYNHEDLKRPFLFYPSDGRSSSHGSSVIGIMSAKHNEYGICGICADVEIGMYNWMVHYPDLNIADGIVLICDTVNVGDIYVTMFGVQMDRERVPIEFIQENFDAIETSVANGFICIEAAGNESMDLDSEEFDGIFNPNNRNSGALFVGAGEPPIGDYENPRGRIEFSNYGRRLDLQAWGDLITTTGYGDLFFPNEDVNQQYTSEFGGTCGASAIVTGAAACLQGYCKTRTDGQVVLTPEEIRDILVETGTPQNLEGREGHIGPQPNLVAAIESLEFPMGYISGRILDEATSEPMAGATVRTRCEEVLTDEDGYYAIDEAIAFGETYATASAYGYNDSISAIFEFNEGDTLEINLSLLHPEVVVSDTFISSSLQPDQSADYPIILRNTGNGILEWASDKQLLDTPDIEPWTLQDELPVSEITGNVWLEGIAFANELFYLTGGNRDTNLVYIVGVDGNLVGSFPQFGLSRYGMYDLTWDGDYLWGIEEDTFYSFTTEGQLAQLFAAPRSNLRTITWDWDREVFWTCRNPGRYIWSMDREGNVLDSIDQYSLSVYGLTYNPVDVNGYTLYANHQNQDYSSTIYKINLETGDSLHVVTFATEDNARSRGIYITHEYDPYGWTYLTIMNNGAEDRLEAKFIQQKDWFNLDINEGIIDPEESIEMTLSINSGWLLETVYNGRLHFRHNAVGDTFTIDVRLDVINQAIPTETNTTPVSFGITSVFPNPFNNQVRIEYTIAETTDIELSVFDLTGRLVTTLEQGRFTSGNHTSYWQALDYASGIYLVKLNTGNTGSMCKIALVR